MTAGAPVTAQPGLRTQFDIFGNDVASAGDVNGDQLLDAPGSEGPGFARVVRSGNLLFSDSFESGDISAWSSSVP